MIKFFINVLLVFLLFKILWLLIVYLSAPLYPIFDDGRRDPTILSIDLLTFFKICLIVIFSVGLAFIVNNTQKIFLFFLILILIDESLKYKNLIGSNSYIETIGFYQLIFMLFGFLSFYSIYFIKNYALRKIKNKRK